MAESALSLIYTNISAEVAVYLGFPRNSNDWTAEDSSKIQSAIDIGYRTFLQAYDWSFMRQYTTLTTAASDVDYDLPDNFGSFRGPITYDSSLALNPIQITGEYQIRALQSGSNWTGYPYYAAVRAKSNDGTSGQRWEVIFYPTPDGIYTLSYAYNILTSTKLTSSTEYPLGGMLHSNTIQDSCIAAAELMWNDVPGARNTIFQQSLQWSIRKDQETEPEYIGYNGDASDNAGFAGIRHSTNLTVTVNGITPS